MAPIIDLDELLSALDPGLEPGEFGFCTVAGHSAIPDGVQPWAAIGEQEGLTLVLTVDEAARAGLAFEGPFRRITLRVHSSLEAVGLTAAVAGALADENISANVIAGFHHDHLLVPADRAEDALAALRRLSGRNTAQ